MGREFKEAGGADGSAEEALRWMARKLSGAMSADEDAAFDAWLAAASEHREAWLNLEAAAGQLDERGATLLAEEFERQLAAEAARHATLWRPGGRLAIAAGVAAAIAIAGVLALFVAPTRKFEESVYATEIGEIERFALPDGSKAELNANSRIAVSFTSRERRIDLLAGEAFFVVAKDPRPFLVMTQTARIKAMGTSFNVSAVDHMAIVHVLEGSVEVAPMNGEAAMLHGGEMIEVKGDGSPVVASPYDPDVALSWRTGVLRFRGESLATVLDALNRYFEPPLMIPDQTLRDIPVNGAVDIRSRDAALAALNGIIRNHFAEIFRRHAATLMSARSGHVAGANVGAAKVAVIEFFDYQCPDCRRSADFVQGLIEKDPTVFVSFRENPTLREESVIASRYALAAREQAKYEDLHFALLRAPERLTEARIKEIARSVGLDVAKLEDASRDPKIDRILEEASRIAEEIGLPRKGTVTFIIATTGGEFVAIVSGYQPDAINAAIAEAKGRG